MDTRDLYKLVRQFEEEDENVISLHDSFDIELNEGFVIETGVVGFTDDGIIIHLDEDAMEFLDFNGVLLESEDLTETYTSEESPVYNAVLNRITRQHLDLLSKYGPNAVMQAVEDVAHGVGAVDEIGSSDVSIWTKQAIEYLEAGHYKHLHEAKMSLDDFIGEVLETADPYEMVYDAISGDYGEEVRKAIQDMYDDVVIDSQGRLHPDDDVEDIIALVVDNIEKDAGVNEAYHYGGREEAHPVSTAIYKRIINNHPELLQQFTVQEISDACNHYADLVGDVDEIGSSDVSIWTKEVIDDLLSQHKELSEIKRLAHGNRKVDCPVCHGDGGFNRLSPTHGYHTVPCNTCKGTGEVDAADDDDLAEGLGKALLGGAALIAAIAGINKMEANYLMKTEPQLIKLAQMRQEAEKKGDKYEVQLLDDRIQKTLDHIKVTGNPVRGPDGKPVVPGEPLGEAEYQGRKVPLGKPMQGDVKKSKVYVKKPNGKVVKVNFGDKNMRIKKNSPGHRKSFRARHHCENPGPRWKARYWSCRAW